MTTTEMQIRLYTIVSLVSLTAYHVAAYSIDPSNLPASDNSQLAVEEPKPSQDLVLEKFQNGRLASLLRRKRDLALEQFFIEYIVAEIGPQVTNTILGVLEQVQSMLPDSIVPSDPTDSFQVFVANVATSAITYLNTLIEEIQTAVDVF